MIGEFGGDLPDQLSDLFDIRNRISLDLGASIGMPWRDSELPGAFAYNRVDIALSPRPSWEARGRVDSAE